MSGEFGPSEEDLGLGPENKDIDHPAKKEHTERQKPEYSEAAKAIYSNLIKEERRIVREIDPEGIKSSRGEFIGVDLLVPEFDEDGWRTWEAHPLNSTDEQKLVFPEGIGLRFRNSTSGTEGIVVGHSRFEGLWNSFNYDGTFGKYTSLLDKLEDSTNRQLDREALVQLIGALDKQRGDLHDAAATEIVENLSRPGVRRGEAPIEINHKNAKLLFELMYVIEGSTQANSFDFPTMDQLKPEYLEGLKGRLKERTGCDVFIRPSVHFHEEDEQGFVSYTIKLLGEGAEHKVRSAEDVALEYCENLDQESAFTAVKRTGGWEWDGSQS